MLKRIQIRNFKSIKDVSVELSPLTVFLGRSGVGKSNIVEALGVLRSVVAGKRDQHLIQESWRKQIHTDNDAKMRFDVEFELAGDTYSYSVELLRNAVVCFESLSLNSDVVFEHSQNKWIVPPQAANPKQLTQMAVLSSLPSEPAAVYAYAALSSVGLYDFGDDVFRFPGQNRRNKGTGLLDDGSNVVLEMANLSRDIKLMSVRKAILASMKIVNPNVSAIEVNSVVNPSAVIVTHGSGARAYQLGLNEESAGFRRFLAVLLALYQRESKFSLLFEHPEDGIHPGALSLLAEEFGAAYEEGRGQVLLTSHSPQLLDCFGDITDAIRVVDMIGDETRVGMLEASQASALRARLLRPGELLTTDDARIAKDEEPES